MTQSAFGKAPIRDWEDKSRAQSLNTYLAVSAASLARDRTLLAPGPASSPPSRGGRDGAVVVGEQNFSCYRAGYVRKVGGQVDEQVIDRDHADEAPLAHDG